MQMNARTVQKISSSRAQLSMQSRFNAQQAVYQQYPMPSHVEMTNQVIDQASQNSFADQATQNTFHNQSRMKQSRLTSQHTPKGTDISNLESQMIKTDFTLDANPTTPRYQNNYQQQPQPQQYQAPQNPQMLQQNIQQNGWQANSQFQGVRVDQMNMPQQTPMNQPNYNAYIAGGMTGQPQMNGNDDALNKVLLSGPQAGRSMTDIWALIPFVLNFLCWFSIGIVGFATCSPFDIIDQMKKYNGGVKVSLSFDVSQFFDGMPAVAISFGITFVVGILLNILFMRFAYCILMTLLGLGLVFILVGAIVCFIIKQIAIGVVIGIIFLFYLYIFYRLYKRLPALDQVAKMAYQFSTEMAGQYCLTFTFLFIFLLEFVYFLLGILFLCSKYTVSSTGQIIIDPTYQALAYVFIFNTFWLCNTTMQLYKFCISYMCCQWYFGRANQVTVIECLKLGFNHLGSLAFQSLLIFLLYYIISAIKSVEKSFANIALICVSNMIKRCRKTLEKLISSLTTIRIAHSGTNFCESARDIIKQIAHDPFYFLFVIWGADLVSSILGCFVFYTGWCLGIYFLYAFNVSSWALIFGIIICYIITVQVTDLFVQNFQMVLYSIGAFYNLCEILFEKDSQSVKNQKFFTMRDKIAAATSLTDLKVKDLA